MSGKAKQLEYEEWVSCKLLKRLVGVFDGVPQKTHVTIPFLLGACGFFNVLGERELPCFEQTRIGNFLILTTILLSSPQLFGRRPL